MKLTNPSKTSSTEICLLSRLWRGFKITLKKKKKIIRNNENQLKNKRKDTKEGNFWDCFRKKGTGLALPRFSEDKKERGLEEEREESLPFSSSMIFFLISFSFFQPRTHRYKMKKKKKKNEVSFLPPSFKEKDVKSCLVNLGKCLSWMIPDFAFVFPLL